MLDHINGWRKSNGWSRETAVQQIVEAHDSIRGPAVTGIRFEPNTADAFERSKVNADRVFRWLDDSSKDTNLLPANFIPSVLSALPIQQRLHCLNDLLRGLGVSVILKDSQNTASLDAVALLCSMLKEDTEAHQAVAALIREATLEQLITARKELVESIDATKQALQAIEGALTEIEGLS